ncbi:alpha-1,4-glucan--maltose-1-phosphate maltosyltransferase [Terrimesophilobacter mesophilus]|uniref:Alpha-1,4-glucan:maltose-1-phosphate maltosyltransferase n=1 Tax=Terrimesophilobacter mesophilus TaxID=433647 RepID=A0A4R8VFX0_9MICO|nr:alpha-1,4-glucan--maltose-1-phosphate maltosyltransferase [Terrimesophilobacter mesophilus]TFB80747.1 alpha-1,4-glucan--maltose-1-phosphate maltosyltransferase [Terrimesophilobacter mesophilus]
MSAYEPRFGRIPLRLDSPRHSDDRFPAKSWVGEVVPFRATIFKDGHDTLGADVLLTSPSGTTTAHRMAAGAPGTDTWEALAPVDAPGEWTVALRAWTDDWATWLAAAVVKIPAGIDVQLTLASGAVLLHRALGELPGNGPIASASAILSDTSIAPTARLAAALDPALTDELAAHPLASTITTGAPHRLRVERARAAVGSWYEFFPRSEGAKQRKNGSWASGTFSTAARRLPAIAHMGFDVVYLPPIHPIGSSFRKGPNNSLEAGPDDPGSPWAIGSDAGGHDAIHPDLGTLEDFESFLAAARGQNLEVAIDLALQCSPDHPWVTEHPEWFTHRIDGSIAYAENPPKKYQDIYPLDFDTDEPGLREEILRIVNLWIDRGITIFRVDNPHTKPLRFWEWLLHEVAKVRPDIVFLAEAFTRPAPLRALAQVGFQQSYTYFTWRNTKVELETYLLELSHETSDFLRPNLFVNTPDILTEYLQFGGVPAYKIRAAIAATASPSWGVYSGYELIENVARPGSEENIDNEKYQYHPRDWTAAERSGISIAPYLKTLNRIRSEHPALRQLKNLEVHWSDDDAILVYSKYLHGRFIRSGQTDAIIVVANVDPHSVRETTVHLDLEKLGLAPDARFAATDLITKQRFDWGRDNYVRLDAFTEPVHILKVESGKGR